MRKGFGQVAQRQEDGGNDDKKGPNDASFGPQVRVFYLFHQCFITYHNSFRSFSCKNPPAHSRMTTMPSLARNASRRGDFPSPTHHTHPPWTKLFALYLLDAISKNVHESYARRFSSFVGKFFFVLFFRLITQLIFNLQVFFSNYDCEYNIRDREDTQGEKGEEKRRKGRPNDRKVVWAPSMFFFFFTITFFAKIQLHRSFFLTQLQLQLKTTTMTTTTTTTNTVLQGGYKGREGGGATERSSGQQEREKRGTNDETWFRRLCPGMYIFYISITTVLIFIYIYSAMSPCAQPLPPVPQVTTTTTRRDEDKDGRMRVQPRRSEKEEMQGEMGKVGETGGLTQASRYVFFIRILFILLTILHGFRFPPSLFYHHSIKHCSAH